MVKIDPELKAAIEDLFTACREFQITPVLIGGLAVRGYTRRKRYTHDIDLAVRIRDKANLITILKRMGFDYQDQAAFEGVRATKRVGNVTIEVHIAVERLWDMRSGREYTLSPAIVEVAVDEASELPALATSVEDLLILKLLPLRDQDMADVIALILDNPAVDGDRFWDNCRRTGNSEYVHQRLQVMEESLAKGTFREAWHRFYDYSLSKSDVLDLLQTIRRLRKAGP